MRFTDLFALPVLALVVSTLILLPRPERTAGAPVSADQSTTITVTTEYPGASPDRWFVTRRSRSPWPPWRASTICRPRPRRAAA